MSGPVDDRTGLTGVRALDIVDDAIGFGMALRVPICEPGPQKILFCSRPLVGPRLEQRPPYWLGAFVRNVGMQYGDGATGVGPAHYPLAGTLVPGRSVWIAQDDEALAWLAPWLGAPGVAGGR